MQAPGKTSKGVRAAKQSRSLLKHQALLQAGRRLLDTHDLSTLSVAQLTRDAGMSVGSFYSRFEDKDAWFAELLRVTGEQALQDTQALLVSARFTRAGNARKVAQIVRHLVHIHREHRGIFRAAHSDPARSRLYWPQLHAYGRQLGDAVYLALAAHLQQVPAAQRRLRVGIALQLVFGTLVNAVLHNPGPIGLHDKRMETELSRVFLATVRLD
ncbi:MAG: TetR/AcrR family transcriptional regulator [Rubrivivax sp.]|nr:TetR/AcrR family transcriptional regulator [Rubrivivax sp.]